VEGGSLDRRRSWGVRGKLRHELEELDIEVAREVQGSGLGQPVRPAVPLPGHPCQAVGTKESLEVDDDPGGEHRGEHRYPRKPPVRRTEARPREPPKSADDETGHHEQRAAEHDRRRDERDAHHELEDHDDRQRAHTEEVRDPDEPHEVRPPAPAADSPEDGRSHTEDGDVEGEKPGDRSDAHGLLRANRKPCPESERTS